MITRPAKICSLAALVALVAACRTTPEEASLARRDRLGTPAITHVVLIQLKDPARTSELVEECDRSLPGIPGVIGYSCGRHLDMGRSNVSGDYDVGIYVGFEDDDAYRAYLDDPSHMSLVERWRDGWKTVRIFDIAQGAAERRVAPPAAAPATAVAQPPAPAPQPAPAPPDARPAPLPPPQDAPRPAPSQAPTPASAP